MDRRYELDTPRRSLAVLSPGTPALSRQEAMRLLHELVDLQENLDRLRVAGLRRLID